jgi:hypothetical protein
MWYQLEAKKESSAPTVKFCNCFILKSYFCFTHNLLTSDKSNTVYLFAHLVSTIDVHFLHSNNAFSLTGFNLC